MACAARAFRISAVCGNEPMVVVGKRGRLKRAVLHFGALGEGAGAPAHRVVDAGDPFRHGGVVHLGDAWRAAAAASDAVSACRACSRPPSSAVAERGKFLIF